MGNESSLHQNLRTIGAENWTRLLLALEKHPHAVSLDCSDAHGGRGCCSPVPASLLVSLCEEGRDPAIASLVAVIHDYNVRSVRTLWPLHNLELYAISRLQRPVAFTRYVGIMDKNVRAVSAPNETITLGIAEPLDLALHFLMCGGGRARTSVWGKLMGRGELVR